MKIKNKKIIILGGGPAGLGAAIRLSELNHADFTLYEKNNYLGGLSASSLDAKGFLWDKGGHVIHSHYDYFDKFLKKTLGSGYLKHQRESWVKMPDNWVPYPFQNNIRYLKPADQIKCLLGLWQAGNYQGAKAKNFYDWILKSLGNGIAEIFMLPYNRKVWTCDPAKMSSKWLGERVSQVGLNKTISNIIQKKDDISWGPNNLFQFPIKGGTGAIYNNAIKFIQKEKIIFGKKISRVNLKKKIVYFEDGGEVKYDYLINTIPLNEFLKMTEAPLNIKKAAQNLAYNSLCVVGFGVNKKIETSKCWVYFPDKKVPFFRLTFFHHYSPFNVPNGNIKKYSSLMCDISLKTFKSLEENSLTEKCFEALVKNKILNKSDKKNIISKIVIRERYSYPIPTIERDSILQKIQPFLMKNSVYSRGRFGAWKYEIGNMDHCFMQGVQAVDKILNNKKEDIWSL